MLGIGGVRMLRALGYDDVRRFHLNKGHSALLALELYAEAPAHLSHEAAAERVRALVRLHHAYAGAGRAMINFR